MSEGQQAAGLLRRRAGVLLHPTSLPSTQDDRGGDIGPQAHRFLQFLAAAGFGVWQMLPTGPTHGDRSPYQSLSVHAGNSELINLEWLRDRHWLTADELMLTRAQALLCAAPRFAQALNDDTHLRNRYQQFCVAQHAWLDDYALFIAAREARGCSAWFTWPLPLRSRTTAALQIERSEQCARIEAVKFEQFVFFSQWQELRSAAQQLGIQLFGDIPIFVAHDSADVWAEQALFRLDADGAVVTVAGVPPDYFSATGQRWGNPHYDWAVMEKQNFAWWLARIESQARCFDIIRIDHFRGLEAYWEIPADSATATEGRWVEAPGAALLSSIFKAHPQLSLVAENLGVITAEVEVLRAQFQLPGMLILQFAFGGNADNPYLPHNHQNLEVVYTGTHDNDTTLGWYETLDAAARAQVASYLGYPSEPMPAPLLRAALASVAYLAVLPMQDLLGLGSAARMNTPGTTESNWRWQFTWQQIDDDLAIRLRAWLDLYGRLDSR
jgi:4-alpha-glucanotransferase